MRPRTLVLAGLAAALALLAATILVTLAVLRSLAPGWPQPIRHVVIDPRLPHLDLAALDADNAMYHLVGLTNVFDDANKDAIRDETRRLGDEGWRPGDYPAAEAWLDAPSAARDAWDRAGAMTHAQVPTLTGLGDLLPYLSPFLSLARMVPLRAERAAFHSDWTHVVAVYRAALANAGHISRGGGLIHHLVGIAMDNIACGSVRRLVVRYEVPPDISRELRALLRDRVDRMEPLAEAMRYERMFAQSAVDLVYRQPEEAASLIALGGDDRRLGRWLSSLMRSRVLALVGSRHESTRRHVDTIFTYVIDDADAPAGKEPSAELEAFRADRPKRMWIDDPIGQVLVRILLPSLQNVRPRVLETRANLLGSAVFLAVRQYQREHEGRPPTSLDELVPAYLADIPLDPQDPGASRFRYRVDGAAWVVYGVGRDGRDDGGLVDCAPMRANDGPCDLVFAFGEPAAP